MRDQRIIAEHRGGLMTKEQQRQLMLWAIGCVERVMALADVSQELSLRDILNTGKKWAHRTATVGDCREASVRAHALARKSDFHTGEAVARATGHAVATAHMADHSTGAALYALKAIHLAGKSPEAEREWQNNQIPPETKELIESMLNEKEKHFNFG
jgi:hypothetical protein